MAIGVFDSGVGGLTVYKELAKSFPHTNLIYLGDTARVPYGNKSPETIVRYAKGCGDYLVRRYHVTSLIVAGNTISSYAIDELKNAYGLPVLGVIQAGSEQALAVTRNSKIGVIGTRATVRSQAYANMLDLLSASSVKVWQQACPLFVPLVEEGMLAGEIPRLTVKMYLDELVKEGIDTLILACTHYPLLADMIHKLYPQLTIVDSATVMVQQVKSMALAATEAGKREVLITDHSESFESLKTMLVGNVNMYVVNIDNH